MELMVNISDFFSCGNKDGLFKQANVNLYMPYCLDMCACVSVCNPCRENKRGGKRGERERHSG